MSKRTYKKANPLTDKRRQRHVQPPGGKPFTKNQPDGTKDERINRKGAPKRTQSWRQTVMDSTNKTVGDFISLNLLAPQTTVMKFLKKLPPDTLLKDAMAMAAVTSYFKTNSVSMLGLLMDREEGRPATAAPPPAEARTDFSIPAEMMGSSFFDFYRDVKAGLHTEYCLDGGRGSLKSSIVAEVIIMSLLNNPQMHALALRQVANTLLGSVYNQLKWAIAMLGLTESFAFTPSNLEITYTPTGQKIYFRGGSDPANIKSIKPEFGYIGIVWFEEFDQFYGENSVRNIIQSALRGGDKAFQFKSWNTPRTKDHWVNKYLAVPRADRFVHHSTYLTTPKEWLGKVFLDEAEYLKEVNYPAYEHEYLGVANGAGGLVFPNVVIRRITQKEIESFNKAEHGLDWGFAVDPASYGKMSYIPAQRKLYIYGEYRSWKESNEQLHKGILKAGYNNAELLIADSASPKDIADLRKFGANCRGSEKGKDSVHYSIKWLQNLTEIVIDPEKAPYHKEEFINYEYERTKDGEIISAYPDKNNHAIDDTRYAENLNWRKPGE